MTFLAESGAASAQTPKMRKIELNAKMAAIYVNASLELVQDGQDFATNLQTALQASIGYGIDRYCIAGSGAGCPQGVLSAPCKIRLKPKLGRTLTRWFMAISKTFRAAVEPTEGRILV